VTGSLYGLTADAGLNQNAVVGSTVYLNGTASYDVGGLPLSYQWSFYQVPTGSNAVLVNPTSPLATFVPDLPGYYFATLLVSNGTVNSGLYSTSVTIKVAPPQSNWLGQEEIGNAGPDQTVAVGSTVQLDASGSTDIAGLPLTIHFWQLWYLSNNTGQWVYQGSTPFSNPNIINPTFVASSAGSYFAVLTVQDTFDAGPYPASESAPTVVKISTVNSQPIANAGPNQIINAPHTVQLDGTGSTDVDGNALTYKWGMLSKPTGSAAALSSSTFPRPTFYADIVGTYVLQLVVNDGTLNSLPACGSNNSGITTTGGRTSTVTITNSAIAPIANPGPALTVAVGGFASLDGANSSDPDGHVLSYRWTLLSAPAGSTASLSLSTSPNPYFTADVSGKYAVQLIVNDGFMDSAPATVLISTDNSRPVADAGDHQTVAIGSTVQLSGAESNDADGNPLTYRWAILYQPSGANAVLSSATTVDPTFVASIAGLYVVQLIVNDGQLNSPPFTTWINAAVDQPPVVSAGPNQTITLPVNRVTLYGSATGYGLPNHPLTDSWTQVSGPASVTFSSPNTAITDAFFSAVGTYVLKLTANDTQLSNSATTTITVNPAPSTIVLAPAMAGPNVTGTAQTLTATVTQAGVPVVGAAVQFTVTGANATSGNATTNSSGVAMFSYVGASQGADTVQATLGTSTSNTASITWIAPVTISTGTVCGHFFSSDGSGSFDTLPTATPAFTQCFPSINFNPPSGSIPGSPAGIGLDTRPFTDVTTDRSGNFNGSIVAGGNGLQAGVGSLSNFQAVFAGTFTVASAGNVSLTFYSDDGFMLGIGGGATRVSGPMVGVPPSGLVPFSNVPVIGAYNAADAPPSFVQSESVFLPYIGAGGASGSLTVQAGDLILAVPKWSPSSGPNTASVATISDTLGNHWSQIGPTRYTSGTTHPITGYAVFAAIVAASGADQISYTLSQSMGNQSLAVYEAAGMDAALSSSVFASGTGTNVNSGALLTNDSQWLLEIAASWGGSFVTTMPSAPGFTARVGQGGSFHADEIYVQDNGAVSPAGSYSLNGTLSGITDWSSMLIGLPPASPHTVVVNFPAPGSYPYELDYAQCCGGRLTFRMTQGAYNHVVVPPTGSLALSPTNPAPLPAGQSQSFTVLATDASGAPVPNNGVSLFIYGANTQHLTATTNSGGLATFQYTGNNAGTDAVQAISNISGMTSYSNAVNVPWTVPTGGGGGTFVPQGWIGSPLIGAVVQGQVPITVASGITLTSGVLEYWPTSNPSAVTVLNSNTTGTGTIGTFDGTLLPSGGYTIQLTATSSTGATQISLTAVTVTGEYKPGRERVTVTDFKVPLAGIPISISRTYDSLARSTVSDFGNGWSLAVGVNLTVDAFDNVTFNFNNQAVTFNFVPQAQNGLFPWLLVPVYAAAPGYHGTLTSDGCNALVQVQNTVVCFPSGSMYQPATFYYTDPSGRMYTLAATGQLKSIKDLNNNTLTFAPTGITSSVGGVIVPFVRDGQGRITRITDLNQNNYVYTYDTCGSGNLCSVTYPGISTPAQYTYATDHSLLTRTDPNNNTWTNTYYTSGSDNGRLKSVTSPSVTGANGSPTQYLTQYSYNVATNTTTTTNPDTGVVTETNDNFGKPLIIIDPLTNTTTFTYYPHETLHTKVDPLNQAQNLATVYTYDANDFLHTLTDPLNHQTTWINNQFGEVTSTTDAAQQNTSTIGYDAFFNPYTSSDSFGPLYTRTFDSLGNILTQTDANGNATQFTYDSKGNLLKAVDALNEGWTYTYDSMDRILSRTDPLQDQTLYVYDALGNRTDTTDAVGHVSRSTYDLNGNKTSDVDPLGRTTSYAYDALNRLVTVSYPDQTTKQYIYDFRNNKLSETDQSGRVTQSQYYLDGRLKSVTYGFGTSDAGTVQYTYDADGNKKTVIDEVNNTTTYFYDAANRLTSVKDALTNVTQYGYDADNRRTSMIDANNNPATTYAYDLRSRLKTVTHPDQTTDQYTSDGVGNQKTATDQAGKLTQRSYDAANRLLSVTDPLTKVTQYAYDPAGNLLSITDTNNHVTSFQYDSLNHKIMRGLPMGMVETSAYDAVGNFSAKTDFNGKITTYSYDKLNRLLKKTPDASLSQPNITFTYFPTGTRQTLTDASGTTTYTYDNRDRLKTKATPAGTLSYTYDAHGNLLTIVSSSTNGASVTYTPDALNRVGTVVDNRLVAQGVTSATTTYTYYPVGTVQNYNYSTNAVQTAYTYDTQNRLKTMGSTKGSTTLSSFTYTPFPAGNVQTIAEVSGRTVNYGYDNDYHLQSETIANDPGGSNYNGAETYSYDFVGNRKTLASTIPALPGSVSYTYDANDRLSTDTYDNNGNTTISGGVTNTYDFENRMLTHGAVSMVYDGDGNRVSETAGGVTTKFLVDTLNPTGYSQVLDELVNGSVTKMYTYGLQRISENQLSGSTWTPTFYGYDGHGNVRFLTSTTGALGNTYQFDAFGMPIASTGTTANSYLYSGERLDSTLGLYHLRARYYNQSTGRFETIDPGTEQKSCCSSRSCGPRVRNLYAYADDDPANRIDPSGRDAIAEYVVDLRPLLIASAGVYLLAKNLRCIEQLSKCIDECVAEVGTNEWPFRKCVAACMLAAGCDYTIPRPWPQ
jgi:RHS repeat-associated protein